MPWNCLLLTHRISLCLSIHSSSSFHSISLSHCDIIKMTTINLNYISLDVGAAAVIVVVVVIIKREEEIFLTSFYLVRNFSLIPCLVITCRLFISIPLLLDLYLQIIMNEMNKLRERQKMKWTLIRGMNYTHWEHWEQENKWSKMEVRLRGDCTSI